jgi:hypothetical protein
VIEVTSLDDSGPGSLREACLATGPRIIVFRVGGTIELKSRLALREANSYLTIAGQTAPGDGIQIKGMDFVIADGCHDVVVRYLKFRPGHTRPEDWSKHGIFIHGASPEAACHSIIIDHCSIYWGPDENICTWDYVRDVTFQWCISEGLEHEFEGRRYEASKAALHGTEPGDGANQANITLHHNYFVNCDQRNPLLTSDGPHHIINNLVYNWRHFGTGIQNRGNGTKVNLIGNVYRRGPNSNPHRFAAGMDGDVLNPEGLIYVEDNIGPFCSPADDSPWSIIGSGYDVDPTSKYWTIPLEEEYRRGEPWPASPVPVTVTPAADLAAVVLDEVGANRPVRDALDQRAVADFRNGTGATKRAKDMSPDWWPDLRGGIPPPDSDRDGMPDEWEVAHGFDPDSPTDGPGDADGDGYTNVEEFLNGTQPAA